MKLSRIILLFIFLQIAFFSNAQEKDEDFSTTLNTLEIKVDTIEELKSIDWEEIFSVFDDNSPRDSINLGVRIENLPISKRSGGSILVNSMSIKVAGITKNKENIKNDLKKGSKGLIKALENMTK